MITEDQTEDDYCHLRSMTSRGRSLVSACYCTCVFAEAVEAGPKSSNLEQAVLDVGVVGRRERRFWVAHCIVGWRRPRSSRADAGARGAALKASALSWSRPRTSWRLPTYSYLCLSALDLHISEIWIRTSIPSCLILFTCVFFWTKWALTELEKDNFALMWRRCFPYEFFNMYTLL